MSIRNIEDYLNSLPEDTIVTMLEEIKAMEETGTMPIDAKTREHYHLFNEFTGRSDWSIQFMVMAVFRNAALRYLARYSNGFTM